MKNWLLLTGAIVCEVAASLSLKAALDVPALYVVVVAGYMTSFAFLAAVLRAKMPVGVAYGIWGALGVALTAVLAAVLFHEPLTTVMLAGMALAVAGVLLVQWGASRAAAHTAEQTAT
ncbi:SMR family transporter [Arthrobacter sp.]|uniref:DMT family transporter n=1 Tax=Arthrobacter sp. TaxID=1667 RepID=UPI0033974029